MAEPETILQPSLHSLPEYFGLVLDEVESRGVDIADLRDAFSLGAVISFAGVMIFFALTRPEKQRIPRGDII